MKFEILTFIIIIAAMLYVTTQISYIPYINSRQGLPNKYNYGTE